MVVIPDIQRARQRQDIQTLLAARTKGIAHPSGGRSGGNSDSERNGGDDCGKSKIPHPCGNDKPKSAYRTVHTPNAMGKKIGYPHLPLDRDGGAL